MKLQNDKRGDIMFERFNAPESKKQNVVNNYIKVMETIIYCWAENPMKDDLRSLIVGLEGIKN